MKVDGHQKPDRFILLAGMLCMALLLAIIGVNAFADSWNPLSQSTALSQSYYIWHDSTGYYVVSGNGAGRYPLKTTLLHVGYGCFKFSADADLLTKTISLTLTNQSSYLCGLQYGGRHG